MGGGDGKLAAAIGANFGLSLAFGSLAFAIFVGAFAGLIVIARQRRRLGERVPIPFGPAMALGALLALFYGHALASWYTQKFWSVPPTAADRRPLRESQMKRHNGFTLIELLIVIAIIAILVAILVPVFFKVKESSRQGTAMENMKLIGQGLAAYKLDNHRAPDVLFGYANGGTMESYKPPSKVGGSAPIGLYPSYVKTADVFQDPNNPAAADATTGPRSRPAWSRLAVMRRDAGANLRRHRHRPAHVLYSRRLRRLPTGHRREYRQHDASGPIREGLGTA